MPSPCSRTARAAGAGWLCVGIACSGNAGSASGPDPASSASSSGTSSGSSSGSEDAGRDPDHDAGSDAAPTEAGPPDSGALDPGVAPGGNFDLSLWELQEPIGEAGAPTTIGPAQLEGPSGFRSSYFFTDPTDGSMTFWDPEDGVTTANSSYPRSELREMTSTGAAANWLPTGTNTLSATLMSTLIPTKVCVGQIHLSTGTPASTKPLLELYYYATGAITLGIEATPAGGDETEHPAGNVPLGTKWSYVIGLAGSTISLTVDGGAAQTYAMPSSFDQEGMYFKAGDYDQTVGTSTTIGAKVQLYALGIFHGP
ncbi:MAG TPA: polysaccharide lyase family 7 protein [Polyangiaceae bacterium]|jgi:hypothetical protein